MFAFHYSGKEMIFLEKTAGVLKARWLINYINPNYPIDLFRLLEKPELEIDRSVSIIPCDNLPIDISATIVKHPQLNYCYIMFNTNHTIGRNRFSIAHEIGHLSLNHKGYGIGENEDPLIKKEADDFASELLLPYSKFMNVAVMNYNLDPISLAMKLRDKRHFWASLEATCRRILDIELFTGVFILYDHFRRYFTYNSKDFEPCEDTVENINRILLELKSVLWSRTMFSTKTAGLFVFAKRFMSGQILAAVTTTDKIGHNTYINFSDQWAKQSNLRLAK